MLSIEHRPPSPPEEPILLCPQELEERVTALIDAAGLGRMSHRFFTVTRAIRRVEPEAALHIARGWRELTKTFMFTTIKGLGVMADLAGRSASPPESLLRTIQTAFSVIGDDLNNQLEPFRGVAPAGTDGIHYVWWQDSVLKPVLARCGLLLAARPSGITTAEERLIACMHKMAESGIGTAVQLRVVEAIALNIAIAFRRLFGQVCVDGSPVFDAQHELVWMDSHIRAEVVHSRQVSDASHGMTAIADTPAAQEIMLKLTAEYAARWSSALDEFAEALQGGGTHA